MIDLSNLEKYRENNRIEAKRALGGLPQSIWETYSAFANTLGGIILLGVVEAKDKSLRAIDLPEPERLVRAFWQQVNDPAHASVNILSSEHVRIHTVDGKRIVAITVPRAQRPDRPVYVGGDPLTGTYRRSGEGDYRCTREEVQGMFRDAAVQTQDMELLTHMGPEVFCRESIQDFRSRMAALRPGHVWEALPTAEFLCRIGAAGKRGTEALHPTAAGLLLLGREAEIRRHFPHYALEYRERPGLSGALPSLRSDSGDWSGNLYDFYFQAGERLVRGLSADVAEALYEALANCLTNADYYDSQGLSVIREADQISLTNPGAFRIAVETARIGGISDPRNGALVRMFQLVNVGAGLGSGIPNIYAVWQRQGWPPPTIQERFHPEQITLILCMGQSCSVAAPGQGASVQILPDPAAQKAAVVEYLTDRISINDAAVAALLGIRRSQAAQLLAEMADEGILAAGDGGIYQLKG